MLRCSAFTVEVDWFVLMMESQLSCIVVVLVAFKISSLYIVVGSYQAALCQGPQNKRTEHIADDDGDLR